MRIKSSIKTITILPITMVLILSSYIIFTEYMKFQNLTVAKHSVKKIDTLKNLLQDLSKEREVAIQAVLSNSNELDQKLANLIKKTNSSVNEVVKLYNQNKDDKLLYKIIKDIKKVVNIRYEIKKKDTTYDKLYTAYDMLNSDIVKKINSINNFYTKKTNLSSNSYKTTISLYKSVSDERDFIAKIFTEDADIDNIYMVKVLKNSNIYQSFLQLDGSIKNILSNYLSQSDFLDILKKTVDIKKDILQRGYTQKYDLKTWYELEDKKLGYLAKANDILSKELKKEIKLEGEITLAKIFVASLFILLALYMLYRYFKLRKFFFDHTNLKLLLEKSVNLKMVDEKIDLDTTEGIEKAYKLIDTSLDKIEIERQKAQNENASKTIFLANMSHEIRTPINGIVGFTDLLKKSNLNKEQREYIDIISKSTDNLLEIINNILDLSKIESKKIEIDTITFSPIEEFENAVELFTAKASKKDINLSLFLDPTFEHYLLGDPLKVKEVLLNLISNSIKFTPSGGEVSVVIKKLKEDAPEFEKIYFEVSDNGIGMTKEELSEVFDAFTQADSTITRKYGGTGLGLTISSNYVSLLGGELEVYSKKDQGTTFYFTLEFKKSQPLKVAKYKHSFKHISPLIINDQKESDLTNFLKDYLSFFTSKATLVDVDNIKQNIAEFDRSNLIVITKRIYNEYDFSYLDKTNKKLLIIEPTKEYLNKSNYKPNIYRLIEPIGFFKTVEVLSEIFPNQNTSLLSYLDKDEKRSKEKYKILIAEDNTINLKLMEEMFSQYDNVTVVTAQNGEEAVDKFINDKFDIILMDIAMPVLDGMSATKKIIEYEEINSLTHTPIIALTANALKGDKEKFLSAGMDEYLTKPIKEELLLDMLSKFGISLKKQRGKSLEHKNTPLLSNNSQTEQKDSKKTKDILIYKKSLVETKIFKKVLSPLYKEIDIAKDTDEFLKLLNENSYKAILLDKELQDLDTQKLIELKKSHHESAFILFRNFETRVSNKLRAVFDETIINSADQGYLKTILDNYIK